MGAVVGVDIGTSSVKLLCMVNGGLIQYNQPYPEQSADGLFHAFLQALSALGQQIPLDTLSSIGFSGQTGTYFAIDESDALIAQIFWHEPGRADCLSDVLATFDRDSFIRIAGMAHPRLSSYPLPSLRALRETHGGSLNRCRFFQPKDYFLYRLCGEFVSDPGSWRGFVHPLSGIYDSALLAYAGVRADQLPTMRRCTHISESGAAMTGLRAGLPVAVGYNDFYAALVGLGIEKAGECFDITGTSEHLGVLQSARADSKMISSPFRDVYVHYGVTASSGISLRWARSMFGEEDPLLPPAAPVFLPYLRGERAPVFDETARGLFVGLSDDMDANALKYSVFEGVVFSLYQIYEALGSPAISSIRAAGGATKSALQNRLKASLFGVPYRVERETHGSAMGAVRAAGGDWAGAQDVYQPEHQLRNWLLPRYELYKRLYDGWNHMTQEIDTTFIFRATPRK